MTNWFDMWPLHPLSGYIKWLKATYRKFVANGSIVTNNCNYCYTLLQPQSKLFGHLTVFLPFQCW